jgi:hypothetical protein
LPTGAEAHAQRENSARGWELAPWRNAFTE